LLGLDYLSKDESTPKGLGEPELVEKRENINERTG
jgi:hypothetical protein